MQETKEQARARTEKEAEVETVDRPRIAYMDIPKKGPDAAALIEQYMLLGCKVLPISSVPNRCFWLTTQSVIDSLDDAHRAGIMIARGHENAGRVRPFAKGEIIKPDGKVRYQGDLTMMDGKIPVNPPPRTFPECLNCQHEKAEPQTCKGNPLISGVNTVVCPEHWPVNKEAAKKE